jgi:hypothetical protein
MGICELDLNCPRQGQKGCCASVSVLVVVTAAAAVVVVVVYPFVPLGT